ncbi:hypothetical protein JG688_00016082 [Phytophthora aleatoria]|uniref:DUF659 domain-containing protein n=1 Tax=Phytophthora aleatoria TaxID=2496075 RepID=A0A8J5ID11_9STRA|nr:hypothetical protein JG688_00016082 [Phytophthora aleatoria]
MRDASAAATGTLVPWVTQKATNRFGWMRWIVMCNLPFSFCESEETRWFTNLPSISADTLYGDMERVVKATENIIGEEMPKEFGLISDGWTHGSEHYLAVFGCFEAPDGPQYPLLSMALIMDEPDDALNTDGHAAPIGRFLPFFVLARLMGVPLIGCASHRLIWRCALPRMERPVKDGRSGTYEPLERYGCWSPAAEQQ